MYIDCPTCDYESKPFFDIHGAPEQLKKEGCTCDIEKGTYLCPNGHPAYLAPENLRFMKRYTYSSGTLK